MEKTEVRKVQGLFIEELENRVVPFALPHAEAFCAGGAWHNPHMAGIRFIQDPCNTIDHPMGIHHQEPVYTTLALGEETGGW